MAHAIVFAMGVFLLYCGSSFFSAAYGFTGTGNPMTDRALGMILCLIGGTMVLVYGGK